MQNPSKDAPYTVSGVPFDTAEEAWLWGVQSMQRRLEGGRTYHGYADFPRPCDASDVLSCANELHRQGLLSNTELQVMLLFGQAGVRPGSLGSKYQGANSVWNGAMRTLESALYQKNIVHTPCRILENA